MAQLTFSLRAKQDLEDIKEYYNEVSTIVTARFFNEFFFTLQFIEQSPLLFQIRYREIRIAPLHKFPYGIHYRERANKVVIYRVLHFKRYFK